MPQDPHDGQHQEQTLFTGPLQVPAGQRRVLTFTTQSNFKSARIAGNVHAQGGSGNDIRVLVVKGQSLVYDSGQRRSIVMSVDFSEPGQYTVIFDNTFSLISAKVVTGMISLVHWGVDAAQNEADEQESAAHYAQASRIIQRLFTVLKADERVLGTSQLAAAPTISLSNDGSINAKTNWETNTIQVNRGVFRLADSAAPKGDDVLAALFSHELSHIFYRHPGYGSSGQGAKGLFDELHGVTALDRIQEKEADILGIRVACQAGFDPQGMLMLIQALAATDSSASSFMKSHPSAMERYRYLEAEASACQSRQPQPTVRSGIDTDTVSVQTGSTSEAPLYATLNTSLGTIVATLFEKEAPNTVENFVSLALGTKAWLDPNTGQLLATPLYKDITFHRVIPNFMIQTGDPTGTGSHNCGLTIKDEIVPGLKYDLPGRLGMANKGRPNTAGCQFFITEVPYPSLNGLYTIFGQVVEGLDVVTKIAHIPRNQSGQPVTPAKLIEVTIKRGSAR